MSPDLEKLADGTRSIGLNLSDTILEKLLAYRDLLLKWNRAYNLTAVRDPEQMLTQHLLDALTIAPWVTAGSLLDVGSGAGLPGIPLAIIQPQLQLTLVDAVQKKTSFQQQAIIELGLDNVKPLHARVEDLKGQYAQITSRAFAELADFINLTRHLLAPEGRWLAMKGQYPDQELAGLPGDIEILAVHPLVVPSLGAARHLVILKALDPTQARS